jgi:hypothetical protein
MSDFATLKVTLKRGALVTAANWPVILIQFVAESTFKLLLGVPVVGGALLVALALGRDLADLLRGDVRDIVTAVGATLVDQPLAFTSFVLAMLLVVGGGGALMFLIKGGTVSVMAQGDLSAGHVEHGAIRAAALARAAAYSVEGFLEGCRRCFRRYLRLGLALLGVYVASAGLYLAVVFGGYQIVVETGFETGWVVVATVCSGILVLWITLVNLLYLLLQMTIAVEDCSVRDAVRRVVQFLEARARDLVAVFLLVAFLVMLATAASIVATAGLGLISFVPLLGMAAFPLQALAWLVRGLVFQYLGLTALGAYLTLYRTSAPIEPGSAAHGAAHLRTAS